MSPATDLHRLRPSCAAPRRNRRRSFGGIKKRASFEISLSRHRKEPALKYRERARRLGTRGEHNTPCIHACAATFLTSELKISGFRQKQKMRLRTFDGDGDTPFAGASPPISKNNVGSCGRPLAPTPRIIAKIGAECPTPRAISQDKPTTSTFRRARA